jgi:hypothetical protein
MDMIKIMARNIFYLSFKKFREQYDNYRDDLLIYRCISRSNGIIGYKNDKQIITLQPEMELTPKMSKVLDQIIEEINKTQPETLDGSGTIFQLETSQNVASLFAFSKC